MKETMAELKGEIDSSTVIVEDFNIPISITKYKVYPKTDNTVSSTAHGKFSTTDHVLGQKS